MPGGDVGHQDGGGAAVPGAAHRQAAAGDQRREGLRVAPPGHGRVRAALHVQQGRRHRRRRAAAQQGAAAGRRGERVRGGGAGVLGRQDVGAAARDPRQLAAVLAADGQRVQRVPVLRRRGRQDSDVGRGELRGPVGQEPGHHDGAVGPRRDRHGPLRPAAAALVHLHQPRRQGGCVVVFG